MINHYDDLVIDELPLGIQDNTNGKKQETNDHRANEHSTGNRCAERNYIFHEQGIVEIHYTVIIH